MTISRSEGERVIRIAAAVVVNDAGWTLLVRKRGTRAFMQAGGKLGEDESPLAALTREIREELGCELGEHCRPLGLYSASAANEEGCTVEAELFAVDLIGDVFPTAEIEEAVWHDPFAGEEELVLAPLTREHVLPIVRAEAAARSGLGCA